MDKFTEKSGVATDGGEGVTAKRTKKVMQTRTYTDGGYMKKINEEVEVTDDEEVRNGRTREL